MSEEVAVGRDPTGLDEWRCLFFWWGFRGSLSFLSDLEWEALSSERGGREDELEDEGREGLDPGLYGPPDFFF